MGRLTLEDVTKFLISFDNFLKKPTHIGLIGGAALLIFKIRPSTHDIDIVFFDKGGLAESSHFLEDYSKVNEVEIQYGMSGRFASMLINEDMFKHSKVVPGIEETFFHTYKFRNLHIHILEPKYFALVKVEAASKGGPTWKMR
ncbi:MAG TPA: hypothetical protein VJI46_03755 [Candidatus Nanoarchaeia archaeon]|nr:hypothetical protein [Candidatus Nanoarchaeia archaeon]